MQEAAPAIDPPSGLNEDSRFETPEPDAEDDRPASTAPVEPLPAADDDAHDRWATVVPEPLVGEEHLTPSTWVPLIAGPRRRAATESVHLFDPTGWRIVAEQDQDLPASVPSPTPPAEDPDLFVTHVTPAPGTVPAPKSWYESGLQTEEPARRFPILTALATLVLAGVAISSWWVIPAWTERRHSPTPPVVKPPQIATTPTRVGNAPTDAVEPAHTEKKAALELQALKKRRFTEACRRRACSRLVQRVSAAVVEKHRR